MDRQYLSKLTNKTLACSFTTIRNPISVSESNRKPMNSETITLRFDPDTASS